MHQQSCAVSALSARGADDQRPAGHWEWVGLPQSFLINGQAVWQDCPDLTPGLGNGKAEITCNVTDYLIPEGALASWHAALGVASGV